MLRRAPRNQVRNPIGTRCTKPRAERGVGRETSLWSSEEFEVNKFYDLRSFAAQNHLGRCYTREGIYCDFVGVIR